MTHPLRVLIVDDEATARRRMHRMLSEIEGIEVAGERDSAEAMRDRLLALLGDPQAREQQGRRGRRRMGPAGGSATLARLVSERLLLPHSGRDDAGNVCSPGDGRDS